MAINNREEYLMSLLGFQTREELTDWMNKPERPTGNMMPPDQYYKDQRPIIEQEERIYRNIQ